MVTENHLAKIAVDCAFKIHVELGPGLLESVYETVLSHELERRGLRISRQFSVPVRYREMTFDQGFRADIIVENKLLIELKSVEAVLPVHRKQLTTYLRLADLKLGLLINFNVPLIKEGIIRVANGLTEDPV